MTSTMEPLVAVADLFGISAGREQLLAAFAEVEREATGRSGCIRYSFAEGVGDRNHFLLVSEWRDSSSYGAHYRSAEFSRFQASLHGLLARPSEMTTYRVSRATRPVAAGDMDPRDAD